MKTLTTERSSAGLPPLSRRAVCAGLLASTALPLQRAKAGSGALRYQDPRQPVEARIDDLLGRMTLDEKVAQLIGIWRQKGKMLEGSGFSAAKASTAFPHGVGQIGRPSDQMGRPEDSLVDTAGAAAGRVNRGPAETARISRDAQHWSRTRTRLGIPLILHEEALHGYAAREATSFPQAIALASTWDPELVERCFAIVAKEMRARGVNLALAPVLDVARDPRWGRIEETFGEDPHLVAEIGIAACRGLQGTTLPLAPDKVLVTLKHLAGHGQPENGTNVGPAPIAERTLREIILHPFERAIRELPIRSVMASYNEIDGVPSHANRWLLTDILREEWGFRGAVMSDYGGVGQLSRRHLVANDLEDAAATSLAAGMDVELPDPTGFENLAALVQSGEVPLATVDEAVRRVLRLKFEAGLFEQAPVSLAQAERATNTAEARALARTAAARAMTLLKNDGVLPIDPATVKRLLIVGTHASDTPIGGYSDVPRHVVSVVEGMKTAATGRFEVEFSEGVKITRERIWEQDQVNLVPRSENLPKIAAATAAAQRADAILLVLGENEQLSREAWADDHLGDRDDLGLVGQQAELAEAMFATGKPVIILLLNGRPLAIPRIVEAADAVVEGWYLGEQTGNGVADVLLGRVSPGGKLPVSIPRSVGQLPVFYNHKPSARRGYLFGETKPLFPFGFGLSYTRFEMSAPRLSAERIGLAGSVDVEVDVTNVGQRTGDEVVQLYIRDDVSSATRPVKELKAFKRVTLSPGEKRTVRLTLTQRDFQFWNRAMKRVVEPGTFTIMAGPDSVDVKSVRLTVG